VRRKDGVAEATVVGRADIVATVVALQVVVVVGVVQVGVEVIGGVVVAQQW
jgi:hypothetical protein